MKTPKYNVRPFFLVAMISVVLFAGMAGSKSLAAQPTATIIGLTGTVQAIFQSGDVVVATMNLSLQAGDILETQGGAEVVLEFSDGSQIQISENTRLNLADLLEDADTGARTSLIKLAWGKLRAVLSPGHQEEGSQFAVETPNTLAGVKFSQPVIEVSYDPETDTTTINAETVDVIVTNLRTQRTQLLLRGQRGIVRKNSMSFDAGLPAPPSQESPPQTQDGQVPVPPSPENQSSLPGTTPQPEGSLGPGQSQAQPPRPSIKRNAFAPAQRGIRAATGSTVPTSVGVVGVRQSGQLPQTGQTQPGGGGIVPSGPLPQPGTRPEASENRQRRIIMIHLDEQ